MEFYLLENQKLVSLDQPVNLPVLKHKDQPEKNEHHIPVIEVNNNRVTVKIGLLPHPMIDVHYIEWIMLETKKGFQIRKLAPGEAPLAYFEVIDDEILAAYCYCNIHGLWIKNYR